MTHQPAFSRARLRSMTSRLALALAMSALVACTIVGCSHASTLGPAPTRIPVPTGGPGYVFFSRGGKYFQKPVDPAGPARKVIAVPSGDEPGEVAVGRHSYWIRQGAHDRNYIGELRILSRRRAANIVAPFSAPAEVAATSRSLIWTTGHHIGRVDLSGSDLQRGRWHLPPEPAGGIAEDLVAVGDVIYLSQCDNERIGTFSNTAPAGALTVDWIVHTAPRTCPQALTVAGGYVYWAAYLPTGGNGTPVIGRAPLSAPSQVDNDWLRLPPLVDPDWICSDGRALYLASQQPSWISRVTIRTKRLQRHFVNDGTGAVACAPRAVGDLADG
jgi:hypothetical protein